MELKTFINIATRIANARDAEMGRIRQASIKRTAAMLVREHPELFGESFEQNKKALKELDVIDSKRLRNKIAGYIVRVVKNKKF